MRIGIDVGGTKTEVVGLAEDGAELFRARVPTPRDYEGTLDSIVDLVRRVEDFTGSRGTVGIGIPGMISPATGLVKNANSTWLIGQPLGADLQWRLDRPVRLMNDANCFTLSEAMDGAGAGADVVWGLILGTGVGSGIVVAGRCLAGANLIAGEWGHNPLPWPEPGESPGPPCYCGKRGCTETFLSGPGMERDHALRTGERTTSRGIVRRAQQGDPGALDTLERYHRRLGRAMAAVLNVLDPEVVVLGGGMSNLPDLATAVTAILPDYVFSDTITTRIVRNLHGDSSGVRGAAWLWPVESPDGGGKHIA